MRLDDIVVTLNDRGSWLAPTRETDRYHVTLSFKGQMVSFETFDYPGVYVQTAFRTLSRDVDPDLLQHFLEADCVLVLLDPDEDLVDAPMLTALDDALKHRFHAEKKRPALCVVLTKADRYELQTSSQATKFLQQRSQGFLAKLKALSRGVTVFPTSAVGGVDENGRPANDMPPTGYDNLLRWLVAADRARKRRPWMRWIFSGLLVVVLALLAFRAADAWAFWNARSALNETNQSASERLDRSRNYDGWFRSFVDPVRAQLANQELSRLKSAIESTDDEMVARRIAEETRNVVMRSPPSTHEAMIAVMRSAEAKSAELAQAQVGKLRSSGDKCWTEQARLLMDRYPSSPSATQVREWLILDMNPEMRAARAPIARIEIDSPTSCQYKSEAIRRYLRKWGAKHPPGERRNIERAAELGEMLGRKREWSVQIHSVGEFKQPRRMWVRFSYHDNNFVGFDSTNPVERLSFVEDPISLEWQAGQPLRVQILGDEGWLGRSDSLAASHSVEGAFALLDLVSDDAGVWLTADRRWRDSFTGIPQVRFRVRGIDTEDARIAREFLAPGLRWK